MIIKFDGPVCSGKSTAINVCEKTLKYAGFHMIVNHDKHIIEANIKEEGKW